MIRGKAGKRKIEILAPAGSYESFKAAIAAGADAVYAGGPYFGARAFADNFTEGQLLEAIDYAHLHGRRFYLTVNTLLKDRELDMLYGYLEPLYRQGLDAAIVQDIGVLAYIRKHFPGLSLHASTQMTITNAVGAEFLEQQGVERVVPARELSLGEVREISENTGLEVECFVHGALCYCYSGQCLMSSLIGGRSGNRGQCAQTCRLPFKAGGRTSYLMSLKDICTLDIIPEMAEAGIDSFKIEGRMKKPEYVALVTYMYRKYTDLYVNGTKESFYVDRQDREMLMDIYNRGGFSSGYYLQHNGPDMISLKQPGHAGTALIKVLSQNGREMTGMALKEIHKGDVINLALPGSKDQSRDNYTFGKGVPSGSQVRILLPKGKILKKGSVLFRIRSQYLLDYIEKRFLGKPIQEPITGRFTMAVGEPARLSVSTDTVSVSVTAGEVQQAKNRPLDEESIRRGLMKTGNTDFTFCDLEIVAVGKGFLTMQQVNEMRRLALARLSEKIQAQFRREKGAMPEGEKIFSPGVIPGISRAEGPAYLSVLAETMDQLLEAGKFPAVRRVYVDSSMTENFLSDKSLRHICRELRGQGKEIFLAMPHIFRQDAVSYFSAQYQALLDFGLDGALVRNYESLHFLTKHRFDKKLILDHNLYVFNKYAKQFWLGQGITAFTAPAELNMQELGNLDISCAELTVYGRQPVMVSAQCIVKTTEGCRGKTKVTEIQDRYQKTFPVRSYCSFCYNVVYNTVPLFLLDEREALTGLTPAGFRIHLTVEDRQEAGRILALYENMWEGKGGTGGQDYGMEFTRGHFKRGIT